MRFILKIILGLFIVGVLGYLGSLNSHKTHVGIYGNYSIQLATWLVILITFVGGVASYWLYQLIMHPGRLIQKAKFKLLDYQNTKNEQRHQAFQDALNRRDLRTAKRIYNRLKISGLLPLSLRVQYLEQQRYQLSSAQMMEEFGQLKQQFPNNLQVLLPYLKVVIEAQEWGLAELLSHEILQLVPEHPEGLEGLRLVHQQRNEWEKCAMKEKQLLSAFPQSMVAERLLSQHENHLLKGFEANPKFLKQVNLKHLPGQKSFNDFHRVPLVVSEAKELTQSGQFLKAANLLKKEYEKTAAPVLLDMLEATYHETGRSEKVLQLLQNLKQSSSTTLFVDLVLARLYYRTGQLEEAKALLQHVDSHYQEKPLLYTGLVYLIALAEDKPEDQLKIGKALINSEQLLDKLYQCKSCGTLGEWQPVCPQCNQSYSYVYREHL